MNNIICLDEKYSTTKLLVQDIPDIVNNPDDKFESILFLPDNEERKGQGGLRTKGYFKKSFEDKPLISIITVVFNGEKYLEETIQSVINQTYDNVEYIVIDGGSTDGTLDIIKKFEDKIDYWVSERDKGISDAFNKGISCSLGKLIGILNADDYYNDNSINSVILSYEQEINMYFGSIIRLKDTNEKIIFDSNADALNSLAKCSMNFVYHPTFFVTLEYYKLNGLYSLEYKIAMDYEFLTRQSLKNIKYKFVNFYITTMRYDGISDRLYYKAKLESINIYKERFNKVFDKYIFNAYYLVLKAFVRMLFEKLNLGFLIEYKRKYFSK